MLIISWFYKGGAGYLPILLMSMLGFKITLLPCLHVGVVSSLFMYISMDWSYLIMSVYESNEGTYRWNNFPLFSSFTSWASVTSSTVNHRYLRKVECSRHISWQKFTWTKQAQIIQYPNRAGRLTRQAGRVDRCSQFNCQ